MATTPNLPALLAAIERLSETSDYNSRVEAAKAVRALVVPTVEEAKAAGALAERARLSELIDTEATTIGTFAATPIAAVRTVAYLIGLGTDAP